MFARGGAAAAVSDEAWLAAMLEFEAALARAKAAAGLMPPEAAEAIARACQAAGFDVAELGRAGAATANPVVPLVDALRERVGGDAAEHVHAGATSQDVLDTALVLVARRATRALAADAGGAADAAAALAREHAETPMLARTLLQPALPTTFGLKAAGWMAGIDGALAGLRAAEAGLPVSLGGAVGTLDGFAGRGPDVRAALAADLGLPDPGRSWHADRGPVAALGGALATLNGALARPARDVALLAQGEVAEAREGDPDRGGSSAMPHKRNPVAAISVLACAARTPGLAATIFAAMPGEHERAAGGWQAEWETLSDLLRLTGSAAAWARDLLERLEVDPERMRANLDAAGVGSDVGAAAPETRNALSRHEEAR